MKKYSILIAGKPSGGTMEDLKDIARSISEVCPGLDIILAENALEAFFYLKENKPSAIVLDYVMPDINGLEFLQAIKISKKLYGVPAIIMSGTYTEPADRAAALYAGADSFVQKYDSHRQTQRQWAESFCKELAYLIMGRKSEEFLKAARQGRKQDGSANIEVYSKAEKKIYGTRRGKKK